MDFMISHIAAALSTVWGLTCTDPTIEVVPHLQWPGAYMHVDGRHVIQLREGLDDVMRKRVVAHELAHCGMYEYREKWGLRHPESLDQHEEARAQMIERWAMERMQ